MSSIALYIAFLTNFWGGGDIEKDQITFISERLMASKPINDQLTINCQYKIGWKLCNLLRIKWTQVGNM